MIDTEDKVFVAANLSFVHVNDDDMTSSEDEEEEDNTVKLDVSSLQGSYCTLSEGRWSA